MTEPMQRRCEEQAILIESISMSLPSNSMFTNKQVTSLSGSPTTRRQLFSPQKCFIPLTITVMMLKLPPELIERSALYCNLKDLLSLEGVCSQYTMTVHNADKVRDMQAPAQRGSVTPALVIKISET